MTASNRTPNPLAPNPLAKQPRAAHPSAPAVPADTVPPIAPPTVAKRSPRPRHDAAAPGMVRRHYYLPRATVDALEDAINALLGAQLQAGNRMTRAEAFAAIVAAGINAHK